VSIITLNTCGCNMGNCGAIFGYEKQEYKTYEDVFADFGSYEDHVRYEECIKQNIFYYSHPDSVYFYVEKVTEIDIISNDYKHQKLRTEKFDKPHYTLSFGR
jgi:hypothetical protein